MSELSLCEVKGCGSKVPKKGYKLCYKHWQEQNKSGKSVAEETNLADQYQIEAEKAKSSNLLTSTQLGERFNISSKNLNKVLAELGWIEPSADGWMPTDQGIKLLAQKREFRPSKTPFVLWPEAIFSSRILKNAINELLNPKEAEAVQEINVSKTESAAPEKTIAIRDKMLKFKPTHRATDGHWVRSKAEALICNWLYMSGVAHAYERLVPIEEELYCDFYVPAGKVYIEYWGMENDPKYKARKELKQKIYKKYGLNLIELVDEHIQSLDDYLPKMLLKFNVFVK